MTDNPDFNKLRRLIQEADNRTVALADAEGRVTGVDKTAIKAVALMRASLVLEHLSQLPKVLTDQQMVMVRQEMMAMWMDVFSMGRVSTIELSEGIARP